MKPKTRILFLGTPEFALPALQALIDAGYLIVGVVTQPDEPIGRKQVLTPPPVKVLAEQYDIPVFQPLRLDARDFADKIPRPDLFIVAAYGKIIPKAILDIPRFGVINIHPSLLPRWRGPSPIQAAILAGDAATGVTIMKIDEQMDHGALIANYKLQITNYKTTYLELHNQLAEAGAKLLIEILPRWVAGEIAPIAQDETHATYCKLLTKNSGRIDWGKPAEEIERMIRAYHPWPGTWTIWKTEVGDRRIRIEEADAVDAVPPPHPIWCGG
ncbi:MAG: methionyl-tRNA formyltransferase, partial [Candidatus Sungiibacteriota bacterium]